MNNLRLWSLCMLLIISLVVGIGAPNKAEALTCEYPSIEEEIEEADFIFKGKVLRVEEGFINTKYVIDVKKVWKGEYDLREELILDREFFSFEENGEYIIFASNTSINNLYISPCGHTNESSLSLEWKLGTPSQGMHMVTPWLLSIGVLVIIPVVFIKRRKRKKE